MAQRGRPKGSGDKPWKDAIRLAVNRADGDAKVLARLADRLVKEAMDGNISALQEIGNRLDGKPAQAVEHSGPDGEAIEFIERRIVDPANPNA